MSYGRHDTAYQRAIRAAMKITQDAGEYEQTIFFHKGRHHGRLAVWQHRMEWDVFGDPELQQHLDWNHPDCCCLDCLGNPAPILHVLSTLSDYGWKYDCAYDADNQLIEC